MQIITITSQLLMKKPIRVNNYERLGEVRIKREIVPCSIAKDDFR